MTTKTLSLSEVLQAAAERVLDADSPDTVRLDAARFAELLEEAAAVAAQVEADVERARWQHGDPAAYPGWVTDLAAVMRVDDERPVAVAAAAPVVPVLVPDVPEQRDLLDEAMRRCSEHGGVVARAHCVPCAVLAAAPRPVVAQSWCPCGWTAWVEQGATDAELVAHSLAVQEHYEGCSEVAR